MENEVKVDLKRDLMWIINEPNKELIGYKIIAVWEREDDTPTYEAFISTDNDLELLGMEVRSIIDTWNQGPKNVIV